MTLGEAYVKAERFMARFPADLHADIVRHLVKVYGRPLTGNERKERWRSRNGNADVPESGNTPVPSRHRSTPVVAFSGSTSGSEVTELPETKDTTTTQQRQAERQSRLLTAARLIDFLNEKAGRSFRKSKPNLDLICARLSDGISEQNCRGVIARKVREWKDDPLMAKYLRPETLFNRTKLESYLGERVPE